MIRVLLVDDQPLVRGGFAAILSAAGDIEIVGGAGDGLEALERVPAQALQPGGPDPCGAGVRGR